MGRARNAGITQAIERAEQIKEQNAGKLDAIREQLTAKRQELAKARKAAAEKAAALDLDGHAQAAANVRALADTVQALEQAAADIEAAPIITPQEYADAVAGILADWQATEQDTREKLAELADQMAELAADLERVTNDANGALHVWQHELYRDADRAKGRAGTPYTDTDKKQIKDFSACIWGRQAAQHYQYQLTRKTGRGITQPGADPWTAGNRYKAIAEE